MLQLTRRPLLAALAVGLTGALVAGSLVAVAILPRAGAAADREKRLINVDASGVAIKGYDPVAYFTTGRPTPGKAALRAAHAGATYRFATAANKAAFEKNPARYAPQYGGYCAYGVAKDALFDIDPATGQIVDGKLYLNLDRSVLKTFNKDVEGNIRTADANWPGLVRSKGK